MKNKIILITGITSYVISFLLIVYYLFLEFSIFSTISPIERLKVLAFIFVFLYVGCILLYKINKNYRFKLGKFNLWILFLLYMTMLLNMTLFDSYFGRFNGANYLLDFSNFENRVSIYTNVIPFNTIRNYFIALNSGTISLSAFIYNICGNIIAFMPLALFVPKLIPIINKWYKYFITASVFIILIECMQFIFNVGTLDIDDYILNILGSMLFYMILNIKPLTKIINKLLYLNN